MTERTIASLLWEAFAKDHPNYAVAGFDGKAVSYRPVDDPLTEERIEQHLAGEATYGCYQLLPESLVRWIAWDVDSQDNATAREYASRISRFLTHAALPHAVEWSGSKGYHIFIFLAEAMAAAEAKAVAEAIRGSLGLPASGRDHVECFPKQAALTPNSPYGNLIKMPLGLHPATRDRSRFVSMEDGWEGGPDANPEDAMRMLADLETVRQCVQSKDIPRKIIDMLAPFWKEGDRHSLALALSGYFASSGWSMEQTRSFITDLCGVTGDEDLENRLDCVEDTYRSQTEGRGIVGFSRLRELLPASALTELAGLVSTVVLPTTVQQIDSVRITGKVPGFQRVRAAERIIWSILNEKGIPLQTPDRELFWYEEETHSTTPLDSRDWESLLAWRFGLNMKDAFSIQVVEELTLHFLRNAEIVKVHRRSSWDGQRLFVHLDGEEVYILDGSESMQIGYNGECGLMFQALSSEPVVPRFDMDPVVDAWDALVRDLSFARSEDAPASPEQQQELIKAWVLAFFFPELMPTRPLLCCLGSSGSGKTSAMRRLLWVLENPLSDVLELVQDKPDALRASLAAHKFMVLDNMEKTHVRGLVDILNRVATGAEIEQRRLYTTNEVHRIRPDVFLAITAVNLPFSEETLFTRILPVEMQKITNPLPEHILQRRIRQHRNDIWRSLLIYLNEVVASIGKNPDPELSSSSRLADFTAFCRQLKDAPRSVNYDLLSDGIDSLLRHQEQVLMESSPFIDTLEMWMRSHPEEASRPHTITELQSFLFPIARMSRMRWPWNSYRSLERHVTSLHDAMKKDYGVQLGNRRMGNTTFITYVFPWDGKSD